MNLLVDEAPFSVEIDGAAVPINTDFRYAILFEQLMLDCTVSDREKVIGSLELFYPHIPDNIAEAHKQMLWFYRCGKPARRGGAAGKLLSKKIFDYDQDDGYIFAAFVADYNIDLESARLHWWKFKALFDALRPDNIFCKIMEWRGADISKLQGEQRTYVQKMQRLYALARPIEEQKKLDAIEQALMNGEALPL